MQWGVVGTLDIIRCVAPGMRAQAYGDAPCVGTIGGDLTLRQFPYIKERGRKRCFKRPVLADHAVLSTTVADVFGLINDSRACRMQGARHWIRA